MTPGGYKEHVKAKDRARKHKGGGGGAKKWGAGKGTTPLLESRDECTGKELLRLCKLFTPAFENVCVSSTTSTRAAYVNEQH
jgi:hypothetical protein